MAQGNSHEFCYRGGTGWKIAEKRVRVRFVTGTFDPAVLYCCGFHCRTFAISDCECNLGCCDDILTGNYTSGIIKIASITESRFDS